jgi:sugar lactone lactonase YvrE
MKTRSAIVTVSLLLFTACSPRDNTIPPPEGWTTTTAPATSADSPPVVWQITSGLQAPESAYYDAESGFLFLSQGGGGGGDEKDGDGWVSKLTLNGEMVTDKWATGFNSPKGLRSHGGTLWVSDIDRIVAIDIDQGEISEEVEITDAKFLNDLACGPDGAVYVVDMLASRIYRFHEGELSVFVEGEEIDHPNGLLVHDGKLFMAGWGQGFNTADFSTDPKGRLQAIDLETKEKTVITPEPTGNLDGVEADGHGGFLVTDWISGNLFHVKPDGASEVILEFPKGLADQAYLPDRHLLILPESVENKLTALDMSGLLP